VQLQALVCVGARTQNGVINVRTAGPGTRRLLEISHSTEGREELSVSKSEEAVLYASSKTVRLPVYNGKLIPVWCWQVLIGSFLAARIGIAVQLYRFERGLLDIKANGMLLKRGSVGAAPGSVGQHEQQYEQQQEEQQQQRQPGLQANARTRHEVYQILKQQQQAIDADAAPVYLQLRKSPHESGRTGRERKRRVFDDMCEGPADDEDVPDFAPADLLPEVPETTDEYKARRRSERALNPPRGGVGSCGGAPLSPEGRYRGQ
jgi:hypothetical protein